MPRALPQSAAADGGTTGLTGLVNAEEKQGNVLVYTQNYRSGGRLVVIAGTLYAAITTFTANQCELKIGTTVVDRYKGRIDSDAIKDTQSVYNYAGVIGLTPEIADSLRLVEARPSALEAGSHPVCTQGQACDLHWLEFRSKGKAIQLTSTTNDLAGYDGFVTEFSGMADQFWIPVSSEQAGKNLVALLKGLAATCGR